MNAETEPQYAQVEQPFGLEPPIVHCPICGEPDICDDEPQVIPCPHLAFMYNFGVSEFEYTSKDFDSRTEWLEPLSINFENIVATLKNAGYKNNMLAIEITYGGMACRPVWYTDVYGYDYNMIVENDGA